MVYGDIGFNDWITGMPSEPRYAFTVPFSGAAASLSFIYLIPVVCTVNFIPPHTAYIVKGSSRVPKPSEGYIPGPKEPSMAS